MAHAVATPKSLEEVGKTVGGALALLSAAGLYVYFLLGTAHRKYYDEFGIRAEDAGISRSVLIEHVAPGAIALTAICVIAGAPLAGVIARRLSQQSSRWSVPILVAAVPSLLMVLLMSWHFIPGALITWLVLSVLLTRVMDADDLRSAVGWLVLTIAALMVQSYGAAGVYGWAQAREGIQKQDWYSGALLIVHPEEVQLDWVAMGPADRIELGRAFRLLGQTSSQLIVYDERENNVVSLPVGSVQITRVPDPRSPPGRQGIR